MSTERSRIAHILLVAGPSGAGKSTFIAQLVEGKLPGAVRSHLPEGCEGWRQISGNDILKRRLSIDLLLAAPPPSQGVIADYDIVHVHRVGLKGGYERDPAFELVERAELITLVDIRLGRARLFSQFIKRQAARERAKGRLRTLWRKTVAGPLRTLRLRLAGERALKKVDLYVDPDWLDHCAKEWSSFVGTLLRGKTSVVVAIEPVADPQGGPSFRVLP